jgi:alpha-glucosidase (family GH31 glycosyl hydrolase)
MQEVNYYLPVSSRWYNYQTKLEDAKVGQWQNTYFTDYQQALFVRGGSILPLLQHDNCMAILACIKNQVTIEVYLDKNGNSYGNLYLDDGESFNYLIDENASASIGFSYEFNTLTSYFNSGIQYEFPTT